MAKKLVGFAIWLDGRICCISFILGLHWDYKIHTDIYIHSLHTTVSGLSTISVKFTRLLHTIILPSFVKSLNITINLSQNDSNYFS